MESAISLCSSFILFLVSVRAARRWAKSVTGAALWGASAGLLAAAFVLIAVVLGYMHDPDAFYAPTISLRLASSIFVGPIGGALMTVVLWRRAQSR
jgi:hypothetical protein